MSSVSMNDLIFYAVLLARSTVQYTNYGSGCKHRHLLHTGATATDGGWPTSLQLAIQTAAYLPNNSWTTMIMAYYGHIIFYISVTDPMHRGSLAPTEGWATCGTRCPATNCTTSSTEVCLCTEGRNTFTKFIIASKSAGLIRSQRTPNTYSLRRHCGDPKSLLLRLVWLQCSVWVKRRCVGW